MESQILDSELYTNSTLLDKAKFAGFWDRVFASMVDLITYIPFIGLVVFNLISLKSVPFQILLTLIFVIYKPFMEYYYGATIGKMATNIRVVNKEVKEITLMQALSRNAFPIFSQVISMYGMILVLFSIDSETDTIKELAGLRENVILSLLKNVASTIFFISCIIVAFTKKKQGWHDMLAGTYCVKQK